MVDRFLNLRKYSEELCSPLLIEDYSVQASDFASPPKWHLAHVTWFWEAFILKKYKTDYVEYDKDFSYLFNSYYNNLGARVLRPNRGLMTRPSVEDVYKYRKYVTTAMIDLLQKSPTKEVLNLVETGINHEEQHQELFLYDIKYILGNQPTFPSYGKQFTTTTEDWQQSFIPIEEGVYEIGAQGTSFSFDNEAGRHKVYIPNFNISNKLVTNGEYIDFINNGGYEDFNYWHEEGWHWIKEDNTAAPMYWHQIDGEWFHYDLNGLVKIDLDQPVKHISHYEAFAYAEYRKMRLPTEAEWEVASDQFEWGQLWEWTNSAYLPYPGFNKAPGALGEYNGKFMVNQIVLKGASVATSKGHSRKTYRNFFSSNMKWQFAGIRLVKDRI